MPALVLFNFCYCDNRENVFLPGDRRDLRFMVSSQLVNAITEKEHFSSLKPYLYP